jgi:hypothetical protein
VKIDRRQINDDRRRVFGSNRELVAYVCECEDDDCARTVALSADEYERLRATPSGAILAAEHSATAPQSV